MNKRINRHPIILCHPCEGRDPIRHKRFIFNWIPLFRGMTILAFMFVTMFGFTNKVHAASVSWDGGASGEWNTGSNWSNDQVPTSSDDITIDNAAVTATTTAINFSTLTIGSGVNTSSLTLTTNIGTGGSITINNAGTLTQNNKVQQVITGDLTINSGGNLTHTANTTANTYNVNFSAANINLDSTGTINVNGKGYKGGQWSSGSGSGGGGTGGAGDGGGGGYGGKGGAPNGGNTYGSLTAPNDLGSGGGSVDGTAGGAGGGLIILNSSGTLTVNGSVTSNGGTGSGRRGGGSGGGIYLVTGTFAGTGNITADGGTGGDSGYGSGGAGGRISINYNTDSSGLGTLTTYGKTGGQNGSTSGAGTIYKATQGGANRTLIIDNNSNTNTSTGTPLPSSTSWTIDTLNINNAGDLRVPSGTTFTLTGNTISTSGSNNYFRINTGTVTWPTTFSLSGTLIFDVDSGSTFNSSSIALTIANGGTLQLHDTTQLTFSSITVQSGGTINHTTHSSSKLYNVNLVATNITIDNGGAINVTGKGYGVYNSGAYGPGAGGVGGAGNGGGGGHGGAGGNGNSNATGGKSYDSLTTPNDLGSGGGGFNGNDGGPGGGLIILNITGTLTINGTINANGSNGTGRGGGGGGGGVYLVAGTLAGTGSITANGGNSGGDTGYGGGGGGGRIAINATTNSATLSSLIVNGGTKACANCTNSFSGTIYFGTPTFDNVSVTANTNYNQTLTGVKTISFWIKPTTTSPGLIQLSSGVEISATDNTISTTGITSPTVYVNGSASTTLTQNDWNHVTVTTETGITADALTLGKMSTSSLTGQVDDLRVFNTPLSASQVTNLYNYLVTLSNISTGSPQSEEKTVGPVAYWGFNEGQGTTVNDGSSNKNTGTLGGTTIPTWQTEDLCINSKCLFFDGATSKVTGSKVASNLQTVSFWIKPNTIATQGLINLDGGTHKINTNSSGVISASGFTSPTYYINGVATTTPTLTLNQWNYVSITTSSGFDSTNSFTIGTDGTNFIKGYIDEVKFYSYARSSAQILTDFNSRSDSRGSSAQIGSSSAKILSNGLVGYWKLDEASANTCTGGVNDSCDSSGNSNNGAWNGDATSAAGKYGNGVTFDGTGDYINAGTGNTLAPATAITVSTWAYAAENKQTQFIIGRGATNYIGWWLGWDGNAFRFSIGNGTTQVQLAQSGTPSINTWYHVVGTYDGTNIKIFIDGALSNTGSITGPISYTGVNSTYIGQIAGSGGSDTRYWNGKIDEARIYNRALSPAEVSQLYNFAPGPVLHLNMDQKVKGDSKTLTDSSGFGNNGTTVDGTNNTGMDCIKNPGKYGGACEFDGTDDYISLGSFDEIDNLSQLTISGWMNYGASLGQYEPLFTTRSNDGTQRILIGNGAGNGNLEVIVANGTNDYDVINNIFSTNRWYYISVVFDGTQSNYQNRIKVYVDGIYRAPNADSGSAPTTIPTFTVDSYIGGGGNEGRYLSGLIDDVKIYNYARTSAQIQEDMAGTSALIRSSSGRIPLAHYRFDEGYSTTANNSGSQGSTLNGTLTSMASPATSTSGWTQSGKFGKALNFDGTDDYVDLVSTGGLAKNQQYITLSYWIKLVALPTSGNQMLPFIETNANNGYTKFASVINSDGSFKVVWRDSASDAAINVASDASLITTGQWYHIVSIVDTVSDVEYLYLNGVLKKSATTATGTIYNDTPAYSAISGKPSASWTTTQYVNGSIDEVKIYNYALTSDEVKTDYNQGSSLVLGTLSDKSTYEKGAANQEYCIPGDSTSCAAPVARWDFNEGKDNTCTGGTNDVCDASGNSTDGSISGATWTTGKVGKGLKFDGTDDSVTFSGTLYTMDNYTVETWFKTTSNRGYISNDYKVPYDPILSSNLNSAGKVRLWYIAAVNGKIVTFLDNDLDDPHYTYLTQGVTTINDGKWHQASWTIDKANNISKLYIDGKLDATVTLDSNYTSMSENFKYFGMTNYWGGSQYFNGSIDNVRIFNYVRTPAQVAWDYNRGAPVGHWRMDECSGTTIHDSSSNSNNGTLTIGASGTQTAAGTCTTSSTAWGNGSTGKRNASLNFDGTDDYISIGNPSNLQITNTITVSSWVKFASIPSGATSYAVVSKNETGGYGIIANASSDGKLDTWFYINGSYKNVGVNLSTLNTGQWYLATATYDGSSVKFYLDGVLKASTSATGTISNPSNINLLIGANPSTGSAVDAGTYFNGQIDDARVYNYALTGSQVKDLYNNGAVNFGPSTGSP